MRAVEHVEHVDSQFHGLRPDRRPLRRREVRVEDRRAAHVADSVVAERERRRIGEAARVEPLVDGVRRADAAAGLVRPVAGAGVEQ